MFCPYCGYQLSDDATFCPRCGNAILPPKKKPRSGAGYTVNGNAVNNTIAVFGFIMSFFIMIVGLVCSIIGYRNAKRGAPFKVLAILGIVISVLGMILALILFLIAL